MLVRYVHLKVVDFQILCIGLDKWIHLYTDMNDKPMYKKVNMSTGSGSSPPTINWLLLLRLWRKELANRREGKMVAKNAVGSIFNVNQTKGFIMFIKSKLAG